MIFTSGRVFAYDKEEKDSIKNIIKNDIETMLKKYIKENNIDIEDIKSILFEDPFIVLYGGN